MKFSIPTFTARALLSLLSAVTLAGLTPGLTLQSQAQEPVRRATYRGKVLLKNLDGTTVPFGRGRIGVSNAAGRMLDSTEIRPDGSYEFTLTNEPHTIQVLVRGYQFTPNPLRFNPRGPQAIPTIVATAERAGQGQTDARVPTPAGVGNNGNASVVTGSVHVTLRRHSSSFTTLSPGNQYFLVKDSETGRLLSTMRTNAEGQFRFNEVTGRKITIEARPDSQLRYTPPKMTTTIPRGSREIEFVYVAASEIGTGSLNEAKDRMNVIPVLNPTVSIKSNRSVFMNGGEIEMTATLGRDEMLPNYRYSFLIKFDHERNWRTVAHQQRHPKAQHTLSHTGGFAYKVIVYSDGVALGSKEGRQIAHDDEPSYGPVRMRGVARPPTIGDFIFFAEVPELPPPPHIILQVGIDQKEGQVGHQRWIKVWPYKRNGRDKPQLLPRNQARVTYLVRHESSRQWTVLRNNSPTLEWGWTPNRPGKWFLRVDFVEAQSQREVGLPGRSQIEFIARERASNENQDSTAVDHNIRTRPSEGLRAE